MATHSNILAWRIPGTEEPSGAAVYGVAPSRTRLKRLSSSSSSSSMLGLSSAAVAIITVMVVWEDEFVCLMDRVSKTN